MSRGDFCPGFRPTWSRVVQFRDVSPHNFDGLAISASPPGKIIRISLLTTSSACEIQEDNRLSTIDVSQMLVRFTMPIHSSSHGRAALKLPVSTPARRRHGATLNNLSQHGRLLVVALNARFEAADTEGLTVT